MGTDAGMCLINNDSFGARTCEALTPFVGLDVIQTDDCEWMGIE